ncbi:hypothetical protein SLA2020_362440 [Shorea laevis]
MAPGPGTSWCCAAAKIAGGARHHPHRRRLCSLWVDPQQAILLRSVSDYFRLLTELMACLPEHEKVILLAHNLRGLAIPQLPSDVQYSPIRFQWVFPHYFLI